VSGASSPRAGEAGAGEGADPESLLSLAVEAARMAGGLLLERFRRGDEQAVATKSTPTDLVSEADFASQRAVRELLAGRRPGDDFLGEEDEAGEAPATTPAVERGGLRWVVDPLDGTVNFLFGIPQWCVSVAVQEAGGATLAGAVFDPCREELFTARVGGGAELNGAPIAGSGREDLAQAMVATGLYYDAGVRARQARVLAQLIPLVRDLRRLGSAALDLAWTAAGRYDAYFERGVKLWDVAAGALICGEAGLEVHRLEEVAASQGEDGAGAPLPAGILAAGPALAPPLLALVR